MMKEEQTNNLLAMSPVGFIEVHAFHGEKVHYFSRHAIIAFGHGIHGAAYVETYPGGAEGLTQVTETVDEIVEKLKNERVDLLLRALSRIEELEKENFRLSEKLTAILLKERTAEES